MKVKTSELIGPALDWAVGVALKLPVEIVQIFQYGRPNGKHYISIGETDKDGAEVDFEPSNEWSQSGPIIHSEKIGVWWDGTWHAKYDGCLHEEVQDADDPLLAAMRCYVARRLGDEIEIPEELL